MTSKRDIGNRGEREAVGFLRSHGYRIIDRNYRYRRAEIDIIARKDDLLVFVEVKTRSSNSFGFPESFVSEAQEERIMEAAEEFQFQHDWNGPVRFDIISIEKSGPDSRITHFKDAIQ